MVKIYTDVEVKYSPQFREDCSKIDNSVKKKTIKQVTKIINNPLIGKPMRNRRKGTREVRVKPFRLSYSFDEEKKIITFLRFYHKDKQ